MTQGISGWRRDDWGTTTEPSQAPPPGPTSQPPRTQLDYELPLLPQPLPTSALAPPVVGPLPPAARDAQVRASLDAFRLAMNAPYHTPEGVAWPGTTFQMSVRYPLQEVSVLRHARDLQAAIAAAHLSPLDALDVITGRGTPEAIHAVTQALIDRGRLPPAYAGDLDSRVRIMMFTHGIGLDCAGYVQQAYLRVMQLDRTQAHFRRTDEDLSTLGARGYSRVAQIADVRPGDIVSLGPPSWPAPGREPGHRAIVYDQHLASVRELGELRALGESGAAMAASGPVRIVQVDSSWGGGGDPLVGGVRRETWWHSETTGTWGWLAPGVDGEPASLAIASTPIRHPFVPPFGIFRGAQAP
jgi:hypothetical protein